MDVTLTAFVEQVANGTMMGAIYVLVALGLVLIFGVMEVLNFAHGVLFMAGGYVCDVFFVHAIDNYPAAVILTVITLAIVGVALERAVFRRLRANVPMQIVASLGLILMAENVAVLIFGPSALQLTVPSVRSLVRIGELSFTIQHFVVIAACVAAIVALQIFLHY